MFIVIKVITIKVVLIFFVLPFPQISLSVDIEKDTLGAVSRLGKSDVVRAMSEVVTGKAYSLAIETNSTTPTYGSRKYGVEISKTENALGSNKVTGLDDKISTHLGIGTQIDGLGHIGTNFIHYNNTHMNKFYSKKGITLFGIEKIPPIVTRGILLDMAKYYGVKMVSAGTAFKKSDIDGALKAQGIQIESGDVVIFHSGWNLENVKDGKKWIASQPGLSEEGARYLAAKGIVAIGSDSPAVEVNPVEVDGKVFPVHQILLVEHGIYLLEALNTKEIAIDQVYKFMFILGVPKLSGSVQGIVNPIAIH